MKNILILSLILLAGCVQTKLSGTGIVTPYGTAKTINSEVSINAYK